ncbi:MAG TPA: protein phosphatase 2C domain-containing protein [Pseudonocardiaceae bacterium]|nr:protein phosphatase 2C domain-containing protein [Pseudonocardiaceae bacterium]
MSDVDLASVAGDPAGRNEDYAGVAANGVVVLDGVTEPADGDTGCRHGVAWYVEHLGPALLRAIDPRRGQALASCLADAISETAAGHAATCDLSHTFTPQATVALLRWTDDTLEYLVLSDAAILLAGPDGQVTPVLDGRIDRLSTRPDLTALRQAIDRAEPGSAARDAAVRAHRAAWAALRNGADGFFTAAADPEVVHHAVQGCLPRDQVTAAAALTDGGTRWTEVFGLGDWTALFGVLHRAGARALIDQVRAQENADPARTAFPRGKTHDDASVVLVRF